MREFVVSALVGDCALRGWKKITQTVQRYVITDAKRQ